MKTLLKLCVVLVFASALVVGVLALVDGFFNKYRIKGNYLNCETGDNYE